MIGKLFSRIIRETTNIADVSPIIFSAPGTYNPRYGKQKVTVTGKAQDGGTIAGTPYYNYVAGYYYDNSYSYTATYPPTAGTYTAGAYTPGNTVSVPMFGQIPMSYYDNSNGQYWSYFVSYPAPPYIYTNAGTYNQPYYSGDVPGTPYTVNVAGTSGFVPPSSPYAGTYDPTYFTGSNYSFAGVYFPGGVSNPATVVPATPIPLSPFGQATSVTIPTGGYLTVSFSIK